MADAFLPAVIFSSFVMVLGVAGNSVVCYVCRCRLRKSVLNNFVLSLAVLDVIGCAVCVPLEVTELRNRERRWEPALCLLQRFFRSILIISSVFILVAIATERYRRICHPLSRHINLRQCRIAVIGAVIIAVLLSWPSLFIFGEKSVTTATTTTGAAAVVFVVGVVLPRGSERVNGSALAQAWCECGVKDSMRESVYPVMYFTLLFILFFLCSVLLCVLYVQIAFRIWRPRKLQTDISSRTKSASLPDCRRLNAVSTNGSSGGGGSGGGGGGGGRGGGVNGTATMPAKLFEELTRSLQLRRKRDTATAAPFNLVMIPTGTSFRRKKRAAYSRKRTTFIMFLMTLTSVVSYLPYILVSIAFVASRGLDRELEENAAAKAVVEVCLKSFLISSAVNPFIYGFCNQRFKKECSKLWQGFSCRARESETEETSETPPNS
ncbi:orexin/Hypocretin receptor type 1-like [Babylonia areolata]|uniref:orexin/Hypocretin receptor type 1-like n=1 Tax=Babylonia areolata TaxID=304850 RepID=UPI003FD621C0